MFFQYELPASIGHNLILTQFPREPHRSGLEPDQRKTQSRSLGRLISPAKPVPSMKTMPGHHNRNLSNRATRPKKKKILTTRAKRFISSTRASQQRHIIIYRIRDHFVEGRSFMFKTNMRSLFPPIHVYPISTAEVLILLIKCHCPCPSFTST